MTYFKSATGQTLERGEGLLRTDSSQRGEEEFNLYKAWKKVGGPALGALLQGHRGPAGGVGALLLQYEEGRLTRKDCLFKNPVRRESKVAGDNGRLANIPFGNQATPKRKD